MSSFKSFLLEIMSNYIHDQNNERIRFFERLSKLEKLDSEIIYNKNVKQLSDIIEKLSENFFLEDARTFLLSMLFNLPNRQSGDKFANILSKITGELIFKNEIRELEFHSNKWEQIYQKGMDNPYYAVQVIFEQINKNEEKFKNLYLAKAIFDSFDENLTDYNIYLLKIISNSKLNIENYNKSLNKEMNRFFFKNEKEIKYLNTIISKEKNNLKLHEKRLEEYNNVIFPNARSIVLRFNIIRSDIKNLFVPWGPLDTITALNMIRADMSVVDYLQMFASQDYNLMSEVLTAVRR